MQLAGRSVWVDWEGIPPSAEWMKEIQAAIEAAGTVLFVVSSHSVASTVCTQEVMHAAIHNKRLVPIVSDDIDPARVPKPVADRNWIFFRDGDDFDRACGLLLSAIDTDLEWVRRHTRLLTRAIEWQSHDRDYGYALHGSDLQQSERDLVLGESKEPRLTALQIAYILHSRRDTNRRRNIAFGALSIAATVLVVVGLLFWQKRQESNMNLARDFREKAMTELANGNPLSAEVYFTRSLTIDDALETRQLLLQARAKASRLLWTDTRPAGDELRAFSHDGSWFLSQKKATLEVLELRTRKPVQSFAIGEKKISATAFSNDGRFLVVADEKSIDVWTIGTPATKPVLTVRNTVPITSLSISPGGTLIVAGSSDGTISTWDLESQHQDQVIRIRSHHNRISSLAFTPDGQSLASGSWDNTIKLWAVVSGAEQRRLKEEHTLAAHDDAVLSVAFSPDGDVIASGSWDNRIWLWDRRTGQRLRQLAGHTGGILSLAFSADGQWLASGSEDRTARIWTVETGRVLLALPGSESDVTFTAFAGRQAPHQFAMADEIGTIRLWDLDAIGQRDELKTLRGHQRPVNALMFNPQEDQLASGSWDRTVRLWSLESNAQRVLKGDKNEGHTDSVTAVKFRPDGKWVASASKDGTIRLWDIDSGLFRLLKQGEEAALEIVRDVAFSPDGTLIASANDDGRVRVWNVSDQSPAREFAVDPDTDTPAKVLSVAFSPDGRLLATSSEDGRIRLWQVVDWALWRKLSGHEKEVWQVAFSVDGRILFSASDDRTARVWDTASGQQLGNPLRHDGPVWGVDVAPDGRTLVTGSSDSTAHIWTFETEPAAVNITHRFTLRLSDEPIWAVAFSRKPGNTLLALSGADRNIRVLNMDRLNTLFDDPYRLEQQAKKESGLEIAAGTDHRIAPVRLGPTAQSQ